MGEKIDPTWVAYSYADEPSREAVEAGIARLRGHYGPLVDYPLAARTASADGQGIVVMGDADPHCRWPFFAEDDEIAIGCAYVPAGFGAVTGVEAPSARAALALARALLRDSRCTRRLAPPCAVSVLDKTSGELLVVNDWLGSGRCLEASLGNGVLWTNRAAAMHLFTGRRASADPDAWKVLAGSGWFMGRRTPIEGVEAVMPGSALRARRASVERSELGVLPELLLTPEPYGDLLEQAADEALALIRMADRLWEERPTVELSGGRDSRVVAAAALAAGSNAKVITSDRTIGEADVALGLMSRASGSLEHKLRKTSDSEAILDRPLLERALNVHLLHDGMRHPQKVRGNQDLPRKRPAGAVLSGHGGEIAHGFYYSRMRDLVRIRVLGEKERLTQVKKIFPRVAKLARARCGEAASEAALETLAAAEEAGLKGLSRLEWFYLTDRFAHRQGLASHAERLVMFALPGFVSASFAMKPRERVAARLNDDLVARFVPEWADAPFFSPPERSRTATRRRKLWESPDDSAAVDELLAGEGAWTELYRADRMREGWAALKAGEGNQKWEAGFEGAVYRQAFDAFLERVNSVATAPVVGRGPADRASGQSGGSRI